MFKRLILLLTAAVAVAGSPLAADLAQARERGGGRGRDAPRFEAPRNGEPRWERRGPPEWPRYGGRRERAAPTPYRDPRGPVVRPGRFLPPDYRGDIVEDYGRYRLRPPPRGYAWVRIGRDLALVSLDDGQIFDVAPF